MPKVRIIVLLIVISLGLISCGSTPTISTSKPVDPAIESTALSLLQQGAYQEAAAEYLNLADQFSEQSSQFRLKAATAYYQASDIQSAQNILDNTAIDAAVFPIQSLQKNIVLARIALYQEQPQQALSLLSTLPPVNTPVTILIARHEARAVAFEQQSDYLNAVTERLAAYANSDSTHESNIDYQTLWQQLLRIDQSRLQTWQTERTDRSLSWIELALVAKTNRANPQGLKLELDNWQSRYPSHIANRSIVPEIVAKSAKIFGDPENIALLLPLSGKFQQASQTVREGFFSAWLQQTNNKPELRVYDTTKNDIVQTYQQAIDDGADFIVGPLQKNNIEKLVVSDSIQTTTLVLNYLDDNDRMANSVSSPSTLLFQFGLSPEQEAAQIAKQSLLDGHKRALVITPDSDWGKRLHMAFKTEFEQLGGVVLEQSSYYPLEEDFNLAVKSLLNTDISKQRANRLVDLLRLNIHSETRSRQDVDMIFIGAKHQHAKQITPQLYFERAGKVPLYATSNIYVFTSNSEEYTDMNNILFTDIPWILAPDSKQQANKSTLQRHWPNANATTHRLYAMGYDAYSLINHFPQLTSDPNHSIRGATGILQMDNYGKVQRTLKWARIRNGKPVIVEENLSQAY